MSKQIEIELPSLGLEATATLLENEEPELSKLLWEDLDTSLEMICHHSQATGKHFIGRARPPGNPVKRMESKRKIRVCDRKAGDIAYEGGRLGISITYGPVTEKAMTSGPVAKADNIEDIERIGKAIWESYIFHVPLKLVARRREL